MLTLRNETVDIHSLSTVRSPSTDYSSSEYDYISVLWIYVPLFFLKLKDKKEGDNRMDNKTFPNFRSLTRRNILWIKITNGNQNSVYVVQVSNNRDT
jgi:hypothetical protein